MTPGDQEELRSEIGTVRRFLSALPAESVLEKASWESRLRELEERLAAIEGAPSADALALTFSGRPVDRSSSIDAAFAADALRAFVKAADTVAASIVADELAGWGKLPVDTSRSLRIEDTALGSFGFLLSLPAHPVTQLSLEVSETVDEAEQPYPEAILAMLRLLGEAASDDEDAIADLVAEVHPRAAAKVHEFLAVLHKHDALFAASFGSRVVRFDGEEQLRRALESLADSGMSEEEETLRGTLLGILPESRKFEAQLSEGQVIQGKISRTVEDIAQLKRDYENVLAELDVQVIRVRTRKRFVLRGARRVEAPDVE